MSTVCDEEGPIRKSYAGAVSFVSGAKKNDYVPAIHVITRFEGCAMLCKYILMTEIDANAHHTLKCPGRILDLRLDAHAIVKSSSKIRAATNEKCDRVGIWSVKGKHHCGSFHRIGSTRERARYGTWHIRENYVRLKRVWV